MELSRSKSNRSRNRSVIFRARKGTFFSGGAEGPARERRAVEKFSREKQRRRDGGESAIHLDRRQGSSRQVIFVRLDLFLARSGDVRRRGGVYRGSLQENRKICVVTSRAKQARRPPTKRVDETLLRRRFTARQIGRERVEGRGSRGRERERG